MIALIALATPALGQNDFADQLPRIAPLAPAEALKSFQLLPGFRMELVAAEPDVVDPVALCFDERGRMFVAEMRGYSEDRDKKLSRIRLLEDTDNDGRFEKSTVFADELLWPTAVFWTSGGLLVADAPDILFLEDTDGDGRADKRNAVFTGFGTSNVQGLLNSFQWSLDNRIVGSSSSAGGTVQSLLPERATYDKLVLEGDDGGKTRPPVYVRGRDFALDPGHNLKLTPLTGGGQHGLTFNNWGDRFVCSNSDHLQQIVYEDRYVARNPLFPIPLPRMSIAADGPQADVFRTSPVEPWRELRTKLRVSGKVPGPVERGGLASGYFTSATGITVYRGNAWPEEYRGQVFIADVGSNLVHRKRLVDTGILYRGERIDEKKEFLTSTDNWFRPVQMANAPDGCLYICDMYREVIEHPASLPPDIKKHLDLSSRGRGRIWRVVPENFRQPEPPRLHEATDDELLTALGHPNGWHRDTAARLLYCRSPRARSDLADKLRKMATEAATPLARAHAIAALHARGGQLELQTLNDPHPRVRQVAVRFAETALGVDSPLGEDARRAVFNLADDEDPRVRFQVALALGEAPSSPERSLAALRLLESDEQNQLHTPLLTSMHRGAGDVFARLAEDKTLRETHRGTLLLRSLARQVYRTGPNAQVDAQDEKTFLAAMARLVREAEDDALAAETVRRILESASPETAADISKATNGASEKLFRRAITLALATAADRETPAPDRHQAIAQLRRASWDEAGPVLAELLSPTEPNDIQTAALITLSFFKQPETATILIERFAGLSPILKARAAEQLCGTTEKASLLLDAVEAKQIAAADLGPDAWRRLRSFYRDASVKQRAIKLYEAIRPADRKEVVEAYREALSLSGDRERGKQIFTKQCATCHKVEGLGHELGPSLAAMKQRGAEAILVNVLDPNAEVNPQFISYALLTTDGRALSGLIAAESATSVTLKRAENATNTVLRADIEELKSTGQSLMPEGLEKQLDKQALADLIAYLLSAS